MKKNILTLAILATLASCSSDELVEVAPKQAIGFGNNFVNNSTRAIDNSFTTDNIPGFRVWGTTKGDELNAPLVSIYDDVEVLKEMPAGESNWVGTSYFYNPQYTQYWIKGNLYNFAAFVGANTATGGNSEIVLGTNKLPGTITFTSDDMTDLLYATSTATGLESNNPEVKFNFSHILSKVQFTVVNTIATNIEGLNNYQYKVEKIKITNAYSKAKCTLSNLFDEDVDAWEGKVANNEIDFGHATGATLSTASTEAVAIGKYKDNSSQDKGIESATSHYARFLIPGTYEDLTITCTITTLLNDEAIDVTEYTGSIYITLVEGQAYNFKITLGEPGQKITFGIFAVNEWKNGNDDPTTTTEEEQSTPITMIPKEQNN